MITQVRSMRQRTDVLQLQPVPGLLVPGESDPCLGLVLGVHVVVGLVLGVIVVVGLVLGVTVVVGLVLGVPVVDDFVLGVMRRWSLCRCWRAQCL